MTAHSLKANTMIAMELENWVSVVCPDYTMITMLIHRQSKPEEPMVVPVIYRPAGEEPHPCLDEYAADEPVPAEPAPVGPVPSRM